MKHPCHAHGCTTEVPPKMLMCLRHWRMVPKFAQLAVWKHYVPGQEIRKDPTNDYIKAQQQAVVLVVLKERGLPNTEEGLRKAVEIALPHLLPAENS